MRFVLHSTIFKPRMICCQSVAQQFVGYMRIDFCRAHAGMAEHLLDGKQVGAAFQEMCGKAMPKGVWADGFCDAISLGKVFHDKKNHLSGEACAATVQKHSVSELGLGRDVKSCTFDILV